MAAFDRPLPPLVLALSVVLFVSRFIIYPFLLSPLAKIPSAHWSAPLSPLWILYVRYSRKENATLHAAHQRLGPVVRIGPHELSIDTIDNVRTVYQGGFEKSNFYSIFDNYGVPCMFSTLTSKEHSLRKRMITNIYSKSYLQSSASAEAQSKVILFDRLLPILLDSASGPQASRGLDVFSLYLATTMDFISAYIFGISSSSNFLQDRATRDHVLVLYRCRGENTFFRQELPRLNAFCKRIGVHLCPSRADAANKELEAWNKSHCEKAMIRLENAKGNLAGTADDPVVLKAVLAGIEREEKSNGEQSLLYPTALLHRDISVASEVFDHILAGQETAGLAMTYITWHMSQDLDLQQRLREELLSIQPNMKLKGDGNEPLLPDPKKLDALPLLHAVMMETLRLNAPIGGPEPRRTPHPQCQIGQYTVPGGVRIAALAHTLHRDEEVFPDSERWDPGRWLPSESDDESRKYRNRQFWAFGSGGRMCIGSNFAVKEMKLMTAAIYSNFTTHIVNDTGIEQGDGYTGRPLSEQLYLRFEKL